jgi:putative transposase
LHRPLPENAKIGGGSFCEDSRGHWYINIPVEVPEATQATNTKVGIDLGTKPLASLSCGSKIAMPAFYRATEAKLAVSQRARKSKRAKAIHAKIKNRRKDFLHKQSSQLVKQYGLIVVGNVSPSKLAQTNMAIRPIWQRVCSMPVGRAFGTCCRGNRDCAAAACCLRSPSI